MFDHRSRMQLFEERHEQEMRSAADYRMAMRGRPSRRSFRSAVGHSLVRLGRALASESEPAREPARSR
jgi:hypothetical protein